MNTATKIPFDGWYRVGEDFVLVRNGFSVAKVCEEDPKDGYNNVYFRNATGLHRNGFPIQIAAAYCGQQEAKLPLTEEGTTDFLLELIKRRKLNPYCSENDIITQCNEAYSSAAD